MKEQKNTGRGIFYGVIGVATLVVAIIGATFAYFTATAQNKETSTGTMATVRLNLSVKKVTTADNTGGMIPMTNGMIEKAVNPTTAKADRVCVDDNGNAVCQIYEITLKNDSSAGQFVDGYVALKGGSGTPTDFTEYVDGAKFKDGKAAADGRGTSMRWAQVFPSGEVYSTTGTQVLGTASEKVSFTTALGGLSSVHATSDIKTTFEDNTDKTAKGTTTIAVNTYDIIGKNYIRVSNHAWSTTEGAVESYDRNRDITSALIFNHSIAPQGEVKYYFVVWLSETGKDQTNGSTEKGGSIANPDATSFFSGQVAFVSAQGSEVSATFSGLAKVQSDAATQ